MNLKEFLSKNAWGIIGVIMVMVTFYTLTNYRLAKAEEKLSAYPSADYFDLKFATIEQQLTEVKVELREHANK